MAAATAQVREGGSGPAGDIMAADAGDRNEQDRHNIILMGSLKQSTRIAILRSRRGNLAI